MKRSTVNAAVRKSLLALVAGGLLVSAAAFAGTNGYAIEQLRQKQQQQQQQRQQAAQPQTAQPQAEQSQPQRAQPPQQTQRREPGVPHADAPGSPRPVPPRGNPNGGNGWQTHGPGGWNAPTVPGARVAPSPRHYAGRPPHYVPALPPGYRSYNWNGGAYFYGGGHWYRPYHNNYVVVGAPFGLYVNYLPGAYSTFWVGGTRYYYSDNIYYTYEPQRHGYVVARSPYGDDAEDSDEQGGSNGRDEDLYIYPMRGQSEQLQADDRYECHRWAVKETHYDPTDSNYDRDDRADYDRALTACLTGRGYSVK